MLELLAPAGSMEALRAAVQNGADAVYLGSGAFNARMGAKNFTPDELQEAVAYCHVRGAAVHLTLNTLASDRELPKVAESSAVYGASEQAVPIEQRVEDLRKRMKAAAAQFDFILAAQLRDEMLALEKQIKA